MSSLISGRVTKELLILDVIASTAYFAWWLIPAHVGNPVLYAFLFIGEIYHVFMAITFWFTLWPQSHKHRKDNNTHGNYFPDVDIYIPVSSEPIDVIENTIIAVKNISYSKKHIYILNDGFLVKYEEWEEIEKLAKKHNIGCFTRTDPGGAKAGNINNALAKTKSEIVVVFDADMVPNKKFLNKVIPYFKNGNIAFVQTPQFYKNYAKSNLTSVAWEQQSFFFGPIMRGKGNVNSAFICGTNFAIRRKALMQVGGMREDNIAEDFITSIDIHAKGWESVYLDEILVEGLAPEDLLSYHNQQLRWARGSLEAFFTANPILKKGLNWKQKLQYVASSLYYLNGIIVLIDLLMPLFVLYFGIKPVATSTSSFALFFIPYILLNLYTLYIASNASLTFQVFSFGESSWVLQSLAFISIILKMKMSFKVTSKKALNGNFIYLSYPHILYTIAVIVGAYIGINREGINPSIMTNIAWAVFNVAMFIPFMKVAWGGNREFAKNSNFGLDNNLLLKTN